MNRSRKSNFILKSLLTVCLLSMLSCNKSAIVEPIAGYEQPNNIRKIFPMQVGFSWHYMGITSGDAEPDYTVDVLLTVSDSSSSHSIGSTLFNLQARTITISTDTSLDNTNDTTMDSWLVWIDSNSYTRSEDSWPNTILKTPVKRNLRWLFAPTATDSIGGFLHITHPDTSILVDSTRYNHAIVVERDDPTGEAGTDTYFIVPGVGIVYEIHGLYYGGTYLNLVDRNFH